MFNLVLVLVPGTQWALCFGQGSQILGKKGERLKKSKGLVNSFSPNAQMHKVVSKRSNQFRESQEIALEGGCRPSRRKGKILPHASRLAQKVTSQSFKLPLRNLSSAN